MSDERPPDSPDDVPATSDRERTTDAVDRDDADTAETAAEPEERTGEPSDENRGSSDPDPDSGRGASNGDGGGGDRIAFVISALIGLALAVGAVAVVSGRAPLFEDLLRVRPTVGGGGVGADWIVGNTEPALEIAIAVVHFADVVMGVFILLMVFVHWAAFRRLATRMRPPTGSARGRESTAATDGGARSVDADAESGSPTGDDPTQSDGGASR